MLRQCTRGWKQLGRLAGDAEACRAFASSSSDQLAAIKSLRERSGAPMADVRAALQQTNWEMGEVLGMTRLE